MKDDDKSADAPHGITGPAPSDFSSGEERQESPEPDLATPTGDDSKTQGRGQQGDYGGKGGEVEDTPVDWKGDTYDQVADEPPSESEDEQDDLGPTPHPSV